MNATVKQYLGSLKEDYGLDLFVIMLLFLCHYILMNVLTF
jgi:hypothetical protein